MVKNDDEEPLIASEHAVATLPMVDLFTPRRRPGVACPKALAKGLVPPMQMPRNFTERIVSERLLYAGGTIKVYESLVETSPGHHERLEIVEKSGDSVAILPIDDAGCVHLIREYYAAANARLYSLPKGTIEPNETPEGAALREMQEEVGFAGDLTPLARFHLSPGYLRQQTIVFLARNLQHAMTKGDERTYIQRVSIPYSRAVTMAKNGEFTEARLVAALYLAMPYIGDVVT